jgi:nitrite reductase (NADH) small subunit
MNGAAHAAAMALEDTTEWINVCALNDLIPLYGACALVHDRQVALFRIDDSEHLYAIDNYDPIGKANVLYRGIVGDIQGELVVASPLYKQHFSLTTGQCLEKEEVRVATYDVCVVEGRVRIGARKAQ